MADATDWNDLRISGESWLECEDTQGAHDLSHWALDFIPERPNDPADAEWLKERGWVTGPEAQNPSWRFSHPTGELDVTFYDDDVPKLFVFGEREITNPTRMTVAMFEAAMEAMKHGE